MDETVGLIGTGTMGAAMAHRMLAAGVDLVVHDVRREVTTPLLDAGARWAESPAAVAANCRIVLTSLPGPVEVEAVTLGPDGLTAGARDGDVHVATSTVSLDVARRLARAASELGFRYLDAPVSGGAIGIDAGTLTVLASGDREALRRARPVLEVFAGEILDLGEEAGTGTLLKLVNNAIFLCSGMVYQEALVLAEKAGIAPTVLDTTLASSSASVFLRLAHLTSSREWDNPFFTLALAHKDVGLMLDTADELGVPVPVIEAAQSHYARALEMGLGDQLCFASLAAVEDAAGVQVPARTT